MFLVTGVFAWPGGGSGDSWAPAISEGKGCTYETSFDRRGGRGGSGLPRVGGDRDGFDACGEDGQADPSDARRRPAVSARERRGPRSRPGAQPLLATAGDESL